MHKTYGAHIRLLLSMCLFGTIGLFVRHIPLPSGVIALVRGGVGMLFLLILAVCQKKPPSLAAIRHNLPWLCLSGGFLGFNWILLFEAYRHTTVATATLCYYMAPVLVILVSPLLLKERLTPRRLGCVAVALLGMVGVSGVIEGGLPAADEAVGILLGLGAAALYASVMLTNQKLRDISANDRTVTQLGIAAVLLLPYCLLAEKPDFAALEWPALLLLITVGVLHTGIAYWLYFGSMQGLKAQTVAIFSYLDPVVAVLLSVTVLREPLGVTGYIGAVLILGAALVSELPERRKISPKGRQ